MAARGAAGAADTHRFHQRNEETVPPPTRAARPAASPPAGAPCPSHRGLSTLPPPRRAVPCRAAGGAAGGAAAEPRFAGAVSPPAPSVAAAAAASDRSASAPALPAAEGCPRATGASRPGGGGSVPGRPAGDFAAPGRAPGAAAGPGARSRPAPSGRKLGSARWRRAAARPRGDRGRSCRWHPSRPSSSLPFHRSSTQIPPRRPLAALIPVSEPIQREAGASGANTLIPPPRPRGRAPTAAAACGHPSAPAGSLPAATLGCGSDPPAIISDLCGLGARGRSRSLAVAWGVNSVLYAVGLTGVGLRGEPPVLPRGGICSPQESLTSAIALT